MGGTDDLIRFGDVLITPEEDGHYLVAFAGGNNPIGRAASPQQAVALACRRRKMGRVWLLDRERRCPVRVDCDRLPSGSSSTLIAKYFGVTSTDIGAIATAEASTANAMTCVKPFTIPDRWVERQTPPWDEDDGFDMVDNKGKPLAVPDTYVGPEDKANYTGYNAERDRGLKLVLKADNGSKIAPSFYQAWAIDDGTGASDYRWNIGNCNTTLMAFGAIFTPEPGNMVGPTRQGMEDLIARDPDAHWDTYEKKVISTMHPSPRIVAIPLFDPVYYDTGKRSGRNASLKFVNYLGFFVERMQGNEVVGRITPVGGLRRGNGFGPAPAASFPKSVRLVE